MGGARKYQVRGSWLTAAFTRTKKLPKLDEVLTSMDRKKQGMDGLKNFLAGRGGKRG
jgi:hypothetical protein